MSDEDQGPDWDELLDQDGIAITKNQSCGIDGSYTNEENTYGGSQAATEDLSGQETIKYLQETGTKSGNPTGTNTNVENTPAVLEPMDMDDIKGY